MAEFAYNNARNTGTDCTSFECNYGYHPRVLFEDEINSHLRSYSTNKLAKDLRDLLEICCQNLLYA